MKYLFIFLMALFLSYQTSADHAFAQTETDDIGTPDQEFLMPDTGEGRETTSDELFLRYLNYNTAYNNELNKRIQRLFYLTFQKCNKLDSTARLSANVLLNPMFRSREIAMDVATRKLSFSDMHPSFGQWVDRIIAKGCGQQTQLNFLATGFNITQLPSILPLVNGQTRIPVLYQNTAEQTVYEQLNENKICFGNAFVLGSRFLGYIQPSESSIAQKNKNAGWYEQWVVEACGQYHAVNLAIIPDGKTKYRFVAQLVKNDEETSTNNINIKNDNKNKGDEDRE